jgi:ketosteroid isomerase-like protein
VWRLLKAIPLPLLRPLPPVGWWLLKRLPRPVSDAFLLGLTRMLYREFAAVGTEMDDGLLEVMFEPDVDWIQPATFPDAQHYRGHAGVRDELATFKTIWSDFSSEVQSAQIDPERETVFLKMRHSGRGRASGAEAGFDEFHLYRIHRGRVRRLEMFTDERAANEARYRQTA